MVLCVRAHFWGQCPFVVALDDLAPQCPTHKYVDDTTMSEILASAASPSHMPNFLHSVNLWAQKNDMKINLSKTKELDGGWSQYNHTLLETEQGIVE